MPGLFDRIKDTTQYSGLLSVGTSFVVDNTPSPVYQSFRSRYAINDANIPVAVVGQATNNWAVCWCTYTALDTLRVDQIIFTSNTVTPDAAVTFSGTSDVFVTASSRAVAALREVNTFTANNYFTTGNVGIGTASPGERLSVATGASEYAIEWAGPGKSWVLGSAAGRAYIRNKTDSVEAISILNDGKVGIGTTSPSSPLIVNTGTGNFDAFNGATGTISFGNGVASGTASPAIIGAASSSTALRLVGRSVDGLSSGDMSFDARPSAGGDFTTLTNAAFVFNRFGNNLATILRNGNVGIGTSAPSSQLHVVSATNFQPQVIADHVAGAGTGAAYFILDRARGTPSARTSVVSGDTLGTVMGRGYDGTAQQNSTWLSFEVDGTVSAGNVPGGISVYVTPQGASTRLSTHFDASANVGIGTLTPSSKLSVEESGVRLDISPFGGATGYVGTQSNHPLGIITNNVEAIRVTTSGNVGIGTTGPSAALHVERNQASETSLFINNTNASGYSALRFGPPDRATNLDALIYSGIAATGIRSGNRPLLFESGNGTERMRMDVNGNFGIGTASPSSYDAKLAVFNGNIALTTTQNKLYLYYFSGTNHAHISTDTGGQVTISNGTGGVAERVRINTDGRVGMGRPPDHALDVQSSSGSTVIRGLSANTPTTILSEVRQDTGYNPAFLTMRRINIAGSATPSSVSIGEIRWDGSTTASVYNSFAAIRCDISTNSVNGAAAAIVFGTASGAAANDVADKVWFHANGGVSIGQAGSPGAGCLRLGRFNNSSEGAELQFCRAIDNEVGWYIDLNGAGTGTDPTTMRFVDARSAAVRLELATRGVLRIVNDLGPSGSADDLALGFRGSPNNDRSSAYTLALTDAGRTIRKTSGTAFTVTIPASDTFPLGTCIMLCNVVDNLTTTGGVLSVTGASGGSSIVFYNGSAKTVKAPGTLANIAYGGSATLRKVNTNLWVITGAGVS